MLTTLDGKIYLKAFKIDVLSFQTRLLVSAVVMHIYINLKSLSVLNDFRKRFYIKSSKMIRLNTLQEWYKLKLKKKVFENSKEKEI